MTAKRRNAIGPGIIIGSQRMLTELIGLRLVLISSSTSAAGEV